MLGLQGCTIYSRDWETWTVTQTERRSDRKSWVRSAGLGGIIFDNFEWPLTQVSRSLYTYKWISQMVRVFNCTKHSCRLLGAVPKPCHKIWGRRQIFFAKSAGRCFTPVIEIKSNTLSPHWNFYTDIQLIRALRVLLRVLTTSSVSHACR